MRGFLPVLGVALLAAAGAAASSEGPVPWPDAVPSPWSPQGLVGGGTDLAERLGALWASLASPDRAADWALERVALPGGGAPLLDAAAPAPAAEATLPPLFVGAGAPALEPPDLAPESLAGPVPAPPVAELAAPSAPTPAVDAAVPSPAQLFQSLSTLPAGLVAVPGLLPAAGPPEPAPAAAEGPQGEAHGGATAPRADVALPQARDMLLPRDEALPTPDLPGAPRGAERTASSTAVPPEPLLAREAAGAGLLVLLGLFTLVPVLYHRLTHDGGPLQHRARRALFDAVRARPGVSMQGAAAMAGLLRGTAVHHLRVLERHHLIRMVQGTKEVHLFPQGVGSDATAVSQLALLGRPRTRALAELLRASPGLTRTEAAAALGISPSTLDWHLRGLVERGLVEERAQPGRRSLFPTAALVQGLGPQGGQVLAEVAAGPAAPALLTPAAADRW